jgi:hypothetical protein
VLERPRPEAFSSISTSPGGRAGRGRQVPASAQSGTRSGRRRARPRSPVTPREARQ